MPQANRTPRLYLAGPQVFEPDPLTVGAALKGRCAQAHAEGLFPMDPVIDPEGLTKAELALAIRHGNKDLITVADAVIADVTPFRGSSADVGVAWELGFAEGIGRPAFLYSTLAGAYIDRVPWDPSTRGVDRDGRQIEDFGLTDNLMLTAATIVHPSFDEALAAAMRWWIADWPT